MTSTTALLPLLALLAQDPQWLRLLHFGQADNPGYYLAPHGKEDPEAELRATFEALQAPPTAAEDEHAACRFPARALFLKRRLPAQHTKDFPSPRCPAWDDFRKHLPTGSVALVFSSYYTSNPASSFGHTLLRFGPPRSAGAPPPPELLNHGLNYAANSTTNNALVYAVSGLSGFFRGTFTTVPYYYKVREYNDYESRDLWSYELALTGAEREMAVAHAWELGHADFDYFYLSENCSYHMLTLLEAAAPRLNLVKRLPFWVIPADTVKAAWEEPGLVSAITYRPSARSKFAADWEALPAEERRALHGLLTHDDDWTGPKGLSPFLEPLPSAARIRVLNGALDFWEFRHSDDLNDTATPTSRKKQVLLDALARLPTTPGAELPPPKTPDREAPHRGHGSARAELRFGSERRLGRYSLLGIRFALHDLLDPQQGYPEGSQIEFAHARGRINWDELTKRHASIKRSLELEEATVFRVTTLSPLTWMEQKPSWRIDLGASRSPTSNCDRCIEGHLEFGAGPAVKAGPFTLFAFAETLLSLSPSYKWSAATLGLGPAGGLLATPHPRFHAILRAHYHRLFFLPHPHEHTLSAQLRWTVVPGKLAVDAHAQRRTRNAEASVGLFYYY